MKAIAYSLWPLCDNAMWRPGRVRVDFLFMGSIFGPIKLTNQE